VSPGFFLFPILANMRLTDAAWETARPLRRVMWRRLPGLMLVARYVARFRRMPNLWRPSTFNEHVLAKLLFDRDPRLTLFADKVAVREFVRQRLGGPEHIARLFAVIEHADGIRDLELPEAFVMKPTHMSGEFEIVQKGATIDRGRLEALADSWFRRNFGAERAEWAYRAIPPRVIFEELLEHDGELAIDYDFYCFGGEPRFVRVVRDKFTPVPSGTVYDAADFRLLPVTLHKSPYRRVAEQVPPPPNYARMLEIARLLSRNVDFVRVDLYNLAGRIVFSELTNYPHAGTRKWDPPLWELRFGSYWPPK
jgi:hypothetical protein